jgi:hypothetical protein
MIPDRRVDAVATFRCRKIGTDLVARETPPAQGTDRIRALQVRAG